ncbi:hypothetical protein ACQY0O_002488 [Thecaphora frezii]
MTNAAFPAFEKAQNEHMGFDRSRNSFSASIFESLDGPQPSLTTGSSSDPAKFGGGSQQASAAASAAKPRISKRTNARLQLAAALVEADNERILQQAQAWSAQQRGETADGVRPPPPPEPKLASQSAIFTPFREGSAPISSYHARTQSNASRLDAANHSRGPSVDFLGVALPTEVRARSRNGSYAASVLSGGSAARRPSEMVRAASEAGGIGGGTAPSIADTAGDDALVNWGVDKFLSKEEREKVAMEKRARTNSISSAAIMERRQSLQPPSAADAGLDAPAGVSKAQSEIIAASGASSSLNSRTELLARIKLYRERQENLPPSEWSGPSPQASKGEVADHLIATSSSAEQKATLHEARQSVSSVDNSATATSVLNRPRPHSRSASLSSNHLVSMANQSSSDKAATPTPASASALAEMAGVHDEEALPTSKSVEHLKTVNTRRSHRHLSIFGVTGDNWSDQDHNSDHDEPATQPVAATAPASTEQQQQSSDAEPSAAPAPSATTVPSSSTTATAKRNSFVFPPPTPPAPFALATSDQLEEAFGRRKSAILQQMEGSTLAEDGEEVDMAGIGSYSRSQSRRNSLMVTTMMPPAESGPYTPPLVPSRPGTPSARRGIGKLVPEDPFGDLPLDPDPYAAGFVAAAAGAASPLLRPTAFPTSPQLGAWPDPDRAAADAARRARRNTAALSTKQLQALARDTTFPEHFGIGGGLHNLAALGGAKDDDEPERALNEDPDFDAPTISAEGLADQLSFGFDASRPIQLGGGEPDLSSANWGKPKKKWFRASRISMLGGGDRRSKAFDDAATESKAGKTDKAYSTAGVDATSDRGDAAASDDDDDLNNAVDNDGDDRPLGLRRDVSEAYANEPVSEVFDDLKHGSDDVDDDYISPPRKGPLRPRGLEARLPKTLIMPQPLQGTRMAPKLRLTAALADDAAADRRQSGLYVPEGFVLHDGKGLPPMRSLQVNSANGPRPMFASAGGDQRHEELVSDIKTVEVTRTLRVPAAAPRGIGRRAAAPTTALFRNQLVQNEDEKEGWGWELGTRADETTLDRAIGTGGASDSDEEVPLADLKKRGRAAKRAAKKLAKAKRKRKQARRERRAKREQAAREGRPLEDFGVGELSPDEDLDLSSTTTASSEESEYESDDFGWDSDDERRWIDESKPAGKLYGKSLLDIAEERNQQRKTKARFYGQTQLEEEEQGAAGLLAPGGGDDAASVAPSVARSFRDNPLGYNDTRERMEAAFGTDTLWAREMAKRREDEAREKEEAEIRRLAEIEFQREEEERKQRKKEKRLFRSDKSKKPERKGPGPGGRGAANNGRLDVGATASASASPNGSDIALVSPIRSRTPIDAPVIELDLGLDGPGSTKRRQKNKGANSAAAEWFVESSDEEDDEDDESSSDDEATRRRQALQRVRQSRLLTKSAEVQSLSAELAKHGIALNKTGDGNANDNGSSSDDNVPLVRIKKAAADRRASMAPSVQLNGFGLPGTGGGGGGGDDSSSEEELTLAAIRARRQQASTDMGKLDLDFSWSGGDKANSSRSSGAVSLSSPHMSRDPSPGRTDGQRLPGSSLSQELSSIWGMAAANKESGGAVAAADDDDDSDEDVPLGMRHPNGLEALQAARGSDDEDDKPLGAAHPQAAIIAEQAALIRQLQAENEQARMSSLPLPWPAMGGAIGMGPGMMGMGMPPIGMPLMGMPSMGMSSLGMPPMGMGPMGMGRPGSVLGLPPPHQPSPASGLPATSGGGFPALNVDAASPLTVTGYLPSLGGPEAAMAGMPTGMPAGMPAMMLDPKASTIHNWRTQVPSDATGGGGTPTGSGSAAASTANSPSHQ